VAADDEEADGHDLTPSRSADMFLLVGMSTAAAKTLLRARNGDLVVFFVNGLVLATWLSRLPDVKASLGLSPGEVSYLLLAVSAGAVIGLPSAGRIAHRIGSSRTVRLGAGVALIGVVGAAWSVQAQTALAVPMIGLFGFGLGSGTWDVAQNLEGSVIEQTLGRAIMPWFHAAFSAGTVAGALLGAWSTAVRVPIAAHITVIVILCAAAVMWGTAGFLSGYDEESAHAVRRAGSRSPWLEPRTLLIGVMVLAAAFTEGTANDWLAIAFVDGHGTSAAQGVLALAVFLTFMTAGRIIGTRALDRYGREPVLRLLFAAAIVGCLLVVFAGTPGAYLGAAVWGVGASLGFPVGMSAASDEPSRAALRLSVVATIGYTAFLAGPVLVGFLGDRVGVLRALLAVAVVSGLAILVVPASKPLPDLPASDNER
jgi:MFS family permease